MIAVAAVPLAPFAPAGSVVQVVGATPDTGTCLVVELRSGRIVACERIDLVVPGEAREAA